jgi:hypothetical protein
VTIALPEHVGRYEACGSDRSSVDAFDDPEVTPAISATGRTELIFSGISPEVCAAFPAITAVGKASTPMWPSTPPEPSAGPNGTLVFCTCYRLASPTPIGRSLIN